MSDEKPIPQVPVRDRSHDHEGPGSQGGPGELHIQGQLIIRAGHGILDNIVVHNTCRHTEHAMRAEGRVGRYWNEEYDLAGNWEPCSSGQ
jgi:hypothetical protein